MFQGKRIQELENDIAWLEELLAAERESNARLQADILELQEVVRHYREIA